VKIPAQQQPVKKLQTKRSTTQSVTRLQSASQRRAYMRFDAGFLFPSSIDTQRTYLCNAQQQLSTVANGHFWMPIKSNLTFFKGV